MVATLKRDWHERFKDCMWLCSAPIVIPIFGTFAGFIDGLDNEPYEPPGVGDNGFAYWSIKTAMFIPYTFGYGTGATRRKWQKFSHRRKEFY